MRLQTGEGPLAHSGVRRLSGVHQGPTRKRGRCERSRQLRSHRADPCDEKCAQWFGGPASPARCQDL